MQFFSDNAAPVCAEVLSALVETNATDAAYDADAVSRAMDDAFSALFETEVASMWISTGTAANALALAALCPPYGSIVCHRAAHIQNDECGAPEFYTHGAKLLLAEGAGAKLTVDSVAQAIADVNTGVHWVQPYALSITNATEYGLVYTPREVAALGEFARARNLGFHMDGARLANAIAHLGCSPADLTWRAGVDVLSFGFVKNGGMSAEALIFFRRDLAETSKIRRKRAGHLMSKGRFSAAQIMTMLRDDLWLRNARTANDAAARLAQAAVDRLVYPVEANELFLKASPEEADALRAQGFGFYDWAPGEIRLVTSYHHSEADVAALAAALRQL
ncbi:threonine aldolase family protein [Sphingobium subterraneum]|uniref:Threonine aldolase n=1 Tax=Sphingobium subterraneum TaxID=627688 RepID=A0A841J9A3_9SPHN|nr:beta-eliminating lyase-related protein [Sphingobium subterraneum]MBB6125085.1 threonine aldolase [Sphingobium subterraneum]